MRLFGSLLFAYGIAEESQESWDSRTRQPRGPAFEVTLGGVKIDHDRRAE